MPNTEIGQKGMFFKGLNHVNAKQNLQKIFKSYEII